MDTINALTSVLKNIDLSASFFLKQDYFYGNKYFKVLINDLSNLLTSTSLAEQELSAINSCIEKILIAQNNSDYILMYDLMKLSLLPTVQDILFSIMQSKNILNNTNYLSINLESLHKKGSKYHYLESMIKCNADTALSDSSLNVETTNYAVPTLKYSSDEITFYFHSNANPFEEGKHFATYYSENDTYNYTILGFGFGYHIREFLNLDTRFKINVLETNLNILTLAFIYCDLSDIINNPRFDISLFSEQEIHQISNYINKNNYLLIHYPSLRLINNTALKELLNNYFISISSMYSQKKLLAQNFYYNTNENFHIDNNIFLKFKNKNIIYIGGGPSLEYSLNYLKEKKENSEYIIICAGTVYKSLISHNIYPDYVIIIDAQDNILDQVNNTTENDSTLLYLSTACSEAVKYFPGKKCILFQEGYPKAEEYSKKYCFPTIETGGSVSTAAIDLILKSHPKKLITVGLDLAYTDLKSHSFTSAISANNSGYVYVKSVNNDTVPTTNVLNIYRIWIEKRIKSIADIELINLSHGAYIKGMENIYIK